jgi:hypothetical protein
MSYYILAKRLIITACFVCVVIIGYAFVKYVSTPSQSHIVSSGATSSMTTSISMFNNTPVAVRNAYFSFTYPTSMHAYTQQPLKLPEIADYSYGYSDIESWQLAVSAQTLGGPTLSQDSSYLYRAQHSSQYQLSNTTINGEPVTIVTDTQASGFSKVAFLLFGSDVVHVSLYGNDTSGTSVLNNVFTQVLSSIKWSSN